MTPDQIRDVLENKPAAVEKALLLIDEADLWQSARDRKFGSSVAEYVRKYPERPLGERLTIAQMNAARDMLGKGAYLSFLAAQARKKVKPGYDLPSPIPGVKLRYEVLPAGILRALHVYAPALQNRLKNGGDAPVMVVREETDNFTKPRLFRWITQLIPAGTTDMSVAGEFVERFDNPLPGTEGRGVAPFMTRLALRVWFLEETEKKVA